MHKLEIKFIEYLHKLDNNLVRNLHKLEIFMYRLAINDLLTWNNSKRRKPMMVYGARQVGKTYLIKNLFAESYYKNKYIYINLKFDDDIRDFINGEGDYKKPTSNAQEIMNHISLRENRIIDDNTLLIFDEIQEAMPAITALKDFKDNHHEIPVVASGSLIRIKIKRASKKKKEKFFYPVGSVDELVLYPMNFEEFLINSNEMLYKKIVDAYNQKKPLDTFSHNLAFDYLRNYLLVGSFPENIDIYLESKSHVLARKNLATIYNDYLNDIDLYDVSTETVLRTRKLFQNVFIEINRPHADFRPSLFDEGAKTRDYVNAMGLLELGGAIHVNKCLKEHITLPLREEKGSNYRIYFLDPGFLAYQSDINMADFFKPANTNMGVFFENYVACELASYGIPLFYWKGKNDYEFEFVVKNKDGNIVPIDVKKKRGSFGSIENFKNHNSCTIFVKVSKNYYGHDKKTGILTIPLYSLFLYLKELQ